MSDQRGSSGLEGLLRGPRYRAAALLEALPSRGHAAEQLAFVSLLFFGVTLLEPLVDDRLGLATALVSMIFVLWALRLLRPISRFRQGRRGLALSFLLLPLVLVPLVVVTELLPKVPQRPRLGLQLNNAATGQGKQVAEVVAVVDDSPSYGVVAVGDRVLAAGGKPLPASDPAGALSRMSRDKDAWPGPVVELDVMRDGRETRLQLSVGAPPPSTALGGRAFFLWLSARNLALATLVVLFVLGDGQSPRHIGISLKGSLVEAKQALKLLGGAYLVHVAVSVPLALLSLATGFGQDDAVQRTGFLAQLGSGVGFFDLGFFLVLAATFEEVVFRGFFLTRLYPFFGNFRGPVLLAAAAFGVAHLEQGTLAVFQTGVLGLYFAFAFLRRGRAEAVILAHAAFNLLMFGTLFWLSRSGWLERAQQLLGG